MEYLVMSVIAAVCFVLVFVLVHVTDSEMRYNQEWDLLNRSFECL